jgi:hypothetical protein
MAVKSKLSDRTRNELCPCGSELKQKHCHNDPKKLYACNKVAQLYMMELITEERKKRGLDPYNFTCDKCGKGTDNPVKSKVNERILLCPIEECGGTVKVNEKPKPESKKDDTVKDKKVSKGGIILET